jgi:hypothetical protein
MSIGSIIIGLLLVKQNRAKFISSREHQSHAILYSLPYAMLIWS